MLTCPCNLLSLVIISYELQTMFLKEKTDKMIFYSFTDPVQFLGDLYIYEYVSVGLSNIFWSYYHNYCAD